MELTQDGLSQRIAQYKTNHATKHGESHVSACHQISTGLEQLGIFPRKGGQGRVPATQASRETSAQARLFHQPVVKQAAHDTHHQAPYKINQQCVPRHVRWQYIKLTADKHPCNIPQSATGKTATTYTQQGLERNSHICSPIYPFSPCLTSTNCARFCRGKTITHRRRAASAPRLSKSRR